MQGDSGDDLIISATLSACDMLLKKTLLLMQVLNIHGSVPADLSKKCLSAGTSHWASDAVPGASRDAAACRLLPSPAAPSGTPVRAHHTASPGRETQAWRSVATCFGGRKGPEGRERLL